MSKQRIEIRQSDFWMFMDCKRRFFLTDVAQIQLGESSRMSAANQGTMIHSGLTYQYAGLGPSQDGLMQSKREFLLDGKSPDEVNESYDMASAVCEGYWRWAQREGLDNDLGNPVMVEQRLEMKVAESDTHELWITGAMDLVYPTVLVDFKTKARIEGANPVLGINQQGLTYLTLIWATTEYRPQIFEHRNIVRKAPSDRSKAQLFGVDRVFATKALLEVHWLQMQTVAKDILDFYAATEGSLETGEYPQAVAIPRPTKDCSWACPFVSVCPSISKDTTTFTSLITPEPTGGLFS